jgi:hypothetical protein
MLPLDVGNYREGSNVNMKIFWYIIYMTALVFVVLLLPLALFYYETDEDSKFVSASMILV